MSDIQQEWRSQYCDELSPSDFPSPPPPRVCWCLRDNKSIVCKHCFTRAVEQFDDDDLVLSVLNYRLADEQYERPIANDCSVVRMCREQKEMDYPEPPSSPSYGFQVFLRAACDCSLPALRYAIQCDAPFNPFAIHWLLYTIGIISRDLYLWRTANERIDLLMSTGKMLPRDKCYSLGDKTAIEIFHLFPGSVKDDLAMFGIVIDVSKFDPPIDEMFSQLKV